MNNNSQEKSIFSNLEVLENSFYDYFDTKKEWPLFLSFERVSMLLDLPIKTLKWWAYKKNCPFTIRKIKGVLVIPTDSFLSFVKKIRDEQHD